MLIQDQKLTKELFLYPQTLFNADILYNFRLDEVHPEKQKVTKDTFTQS